MGNKSTRGDVNCPHQVLSMTDWIRSLFHARSRTGGFPLKRNKYHLLADDFINIPLKTLCTHLACGNHTPTKINLLFLTTTMAYYSQMIHLALVGHEKHLFIFPGMLVARLLFILIISAKRY